MSAVEGWGEEKMGNDIVQETRPNPLCLFADQSVFAETVP
jgi:hypothetical protein